MKIDITSILAGQKKTVDFSYEIDLSEEGSPIPPEGVAPVSPIRVSGKVTDIGSCLSLASSAEMDYEAVCDRCADKLSGTVTIQLEKLIAGGDIASLEDDSDYVIEENGLIDIDHDLLEEVMLGFPSQLLCRPDCKGICTKCGCNFNYESCKCSEEKEIDPRWQALAQLLENNGEK